MRYLLVSNFGVGNAGDEMLRAYFLRRFPEVMWQVLSAQPRAGEFSRFPAGIRSLCSLRWLRTVGALRHSSGLVFGGGSLWTDSESLRACIIWTLHAWWARLLRRPYFLAFQGIGPFRTRLGSLLAHSVVRHAAFVSVRDPASFTLLTRCKDEVLAPSEPRQSQLPRRIEVWKKNTEIVHSFDPSLSLLEATQEDKRTKNVLVFIPRFSTAWTPANIRKFTEALLSWREKEGGEVRVLSFAPGDPRERALSTAFAGALGVTLLVVPSLEDVPALLAGASLILTERYHGAVAALASRVPFFALRRRAGDKLDAIALLCDCPSSTLQEFLPEALMTTDFAALRSRLGPVRERCRALVAVGEEALRGALHRGAE